MTVTPGTRLGAYEILSLLGSGGMGEVYRARDTKLNRGVALKVLPDVFAADDERLARFRREAQLLAALNHPNIAAIYGFAESDGVHALVLELVEGPTLADRLVPGPIPLDEAVPVARQIAAALEAAHEQGIVHRDLKPANIKVRSDGTVKVLDFGLAKALESDGSGGSGGPGERGRALAPNSPTITTPAMTMAGVILGTAAYMSPEQAKGRPADKRSDVWAFGCVLYEMLTGRRAFGGEDVSDTLAAVLRSDPDWTAWPETVPPHIRALVEGCVRKDRQERVADISTARFVFDHGAHVEGAGSTASVTRRYLVASFIIGATAVAVASYTAWILKPASVPSAPVARFAIQLPIGDRLSNVGVHVVALSADGSRLVYTANQRLYARPMNELEAAPVRLDATSIRGSEGAVANAPRGPFFSPDGQWIGFWQDGQLKKVSITGGAPVALCVAENPWGATWTADNTILFGQGEQGRGGIWRVSGDGGKPEQLVKLEADQVAQGPQLLPGGHAIVFTLVRRGDWDNAQIVAQSLDTGRRHVVLERGADARFVPTGHLVYALGGTLFAVPFNVTRLAVSGSAVPVAEDVAQGNVAAQFAISDYGALAYVPREVVERGPLTQRRTLAWVDRQGREDPIKAPARNYLYPRLSPDGSRVALEVRDSESDIWIWDLMRETLTRLTLAPTFDQYGVWTPDGRSVIFASSQFAGPHAPRSLFKQSSDGAGTAERLADGTIGQFPSSVTPDGTALILRVDAPPAKVGVPPGMDLVLLPLQGDRRARPLLQSTFDELNGEISPDGRWLAYQSNESGQQEIYVRPFPNVEARKWQVSTNGGTQPLWAHNGRELFYESMGAVMRVPVTTGSAFEAGSPTKMLDGPYVLGLPPGGGLGRMYDVSPDGRRFLMIKPDNGAADDLPPPRIVLVQNWLEELKQRVPTR